MGLLHVIIQLYLLSSAVVVDVNAQDHRSADNGEGLRPLQGERLRRTTGGAGNIFRSRNRIIVPAPRSAPQGTAQTNNVLVLTKNLNIIEKSTVECAGHVSRLEETITTNVVDPAENLKSLIEDAKKVHSATKRIMPQIEALKKMVNFIPKFGQVAGRVVKLFVVLHDTIRKVLQKIKPIEDKLDDIIDVLTDVTEFIKITNKSMLMGAEGAGKSADAVKIAVACADKTTSTVDNAAIETFASGPAVTGLTAIAEVVESCPRIIQEAQDTLPDFRTVEQILEALAPIVDTVEAVAEQLTAFAEGAGSKITEGLCCTIPVHTQSFFKLLTNTIDLAQCFAEDLVEDIVHAIDTANKLEENGSASWPARVFALELGHIDEWVSAEVDSSTCSLSGLRASMESTPFQSNIPALSLELGTLDKDEEDECSADKLHPDSWWGDDCCCAARESFVPTGTACLKFEAFVVVGSYELVSALAGLDRCTCCESGESVHCSGQIGVCGSELPPPKKANEKCPDSGANCFCEGDLPCGRIADGSYICCPRGSWDSIDDLREYCRDMAGPGESCPGHASANDNYCEDGGSCGIDAKTGNYICCPHGSWISGISDYCKSMGEVNEWCPGHLDANDNYCKDGRSCGIDAKTGKYICCPHGTWISGTKDYCKSMGGVNEWCPGNLDANDNYCQNGRSCGINAKTGKYICCPHGTWISGTKDYCKSIGETNEWCPGNLDANDNYCKSGKSCGINAKTRKYICCPRGTWISGTKDYCKALGGANEWCPGGLNANDNYCKSGRSCGVNAKTNGYICCPRGTWISGTKDYCRALGETNAWCPGRLNSNDNYCKNGKSCGKDGMTGKYLCCPHGTWISGTSDYCRALGAPGERCNGNLHANDNYCSGGKPCAYSGNTYRCCKNGSYNSWFWEYCN